MMSTESFEQTSTDTRFATNKVRFTFFGIFASHSIDYVVQSVLLFETYVLAAPFLGAHVRPICPCTIVDWWVLATAMDTHYRKFVILHRLVALPHRAVVYAVLAAVGAVGHVSLLHFRQWL